MKGAIPSLRRRPGPSTRDWASSLKRAMSTSRCPRIRSMKSISRLMHATVSCNGMVIGMDRIFRSNFFLETESPFSNCFYRMKLYPWRNQPSCDMRTPEIRKPSLSRCRNKRRRTNKQAQCDSQTHLSRGGCASWVLRQGRVGVIVYDFEPALSSLWGL